MPISHASNQYLIPRGRVYFDPFDANEMPTGEIAIGNCPGVNIAVKSETKDHYSSETGLRQKDGAWTLQVDRSGKLQCDNFSPSNVALWLTGTVERKTQSATPVSGEERAVNPGRQYQLGASASNPLGVRNVTAVSVKSKDGATVYVAGEDYNVDTETGRIQIIAGGAIHAATPVQFAYTPVASRFASVRSGAKTELTGALRIVSDNAAGGNRDWYLPKVTLSPDGDLALIAEKDDVVTLEFSMQVLKPANAEAIYCDGRPVA